MRFFDKFTLVSLTLLIAVALVWVAPSLAQPPQADSSPVTAEETYEFAARAFDIEAGTDGSIYVAQESTIKRISGGEITDVNTIPTVTQGPIATAINGLAAQAPGSLFATRSGLDLAVGAALFHVTPGTVELVADIESFEIANDPDAQVWKDPVCEEDPVQGFSAGPQTNPYHLVVLFDGSALIGDAAGNTVLRASSEGAIDWVAVLTPPTDEEGEFLFLKNAENDPSIDCYVQPVATSVDVGPYGDYYVGELTGALAEGLPIGLSRVWRIDGGAENVVCPSADCEVVIDGMTSIIDLAFGPDGYLYVVEFDENSWIAAFVDGLPAGGTINRCDVHTGDCMVVAEGLDFPSAITFDPDGTLWLLEDNVGEPVVSQLDFCAGSPSALCLQNGRFRVEATWQVSPTGPSGQAMAVPLSGDSGYFWFFKPSNAELLVKMLNGCPVNGHYWFFAAGLTNVEVTITVTDTETDESEVYTSPGGTPFMPTQDTTAFACGS